MEVLISYSRKLIWFKVGPTNNNPKVIARYYLEAVERLKGMYTLYVALLR